MYFIIFIGIISCFTSVIGSPVNAVVNSTYGNACNSRADCSTLVETCQKTSEHDDDSRRCVCNTNFVWDNEYRSCVYSCSSKQDNCFIFNGACDLSEKIPRCKCASDYRWDPVRKSCAHVCQSDYDCDMNNEICDMSQGRVAGKCICKDGYSWDNENSVCRKTCTSSDMICPDPMEVCYDFSTHCECDVSWFFDRLTKTCESRLF